MRLAIRLARRGAGGTRPNPMVGAVLMRGGRVIGQGWHRRAGAPHAEIEALRDAAGSVRGATLYVTLEPCCHHGRTGPCTGAILEAGIARVVVGCRDPNPLVDGGGIRLLRRRRVEVAIGCLEEECRELIRPFAIWVTERRPLVTLKSAATLDGFIADGAVRRARGSQWITGEEAHRRVHLMRAAHDAILVGAGTVRADDPLLTVRMVRLAAGRPRPQRIVLDGRLSIPASARILRRVPGVPPTLVLGAAGAPSARIRALSAAGAEVVLLPARAGRLAPETVLGALAARDIQTLMVEGGAGVNAAFTAARLVDRVALFLAPRLLGGGVPIAQATGGRHGGGLSLDEGLHLSRPRVTALGRDLLLQADVDRPSRRTANRSK